MIDRKALWQKLTKIALEDGTLSKEEEILIDAVLSDLDILNNVIAIAQEDSIITEAEREDIQTIIHEIEARALEKAEADSILANDEINILTKLSSIFNELKPEAIGPYSPIKLAGNLMFCSGQIALIPGTKKLVNRSIEAETRQALANMKNLVTSAGGKFSNAVKMTVYMTNIEDYGKINGIYAEFFNESKPARAAVEVSNLPANARVEIEGIFLID